MATYRKVHRLSGTHPDYGGFPAFIGALVYSQFSKRAGHAIHGKILQGNLSIGVLHREVSVRCAQKFSGGFEGSALTVHSWAVSREESTRCRCSA